jgi:subtilase family serine protease
VSAAARFRGRRAPVSVAVVLLLAPALLAGSSASALAARANVLGNHPAARAKARYGAKTRYARIRRVCPLPRPGRASCFALLRVPVAAGAAGAAPFLQNDGASESGPAGGLTPAQLASAYEYDPAEGGTGQTVAIVDAYDDPKIEADLGTFDSQYGLPACTSANGCFTKVGQTGSTTSLPKADKEGWSVEIALDVETVHSACENCKILLVEANKPTYADLAAGVDEAVKLGATEVSNSYGGPEEAGEGAAYNHPGVVITASAGDGGYDDWDVVSEGYAAPEKPETPASLPTVVAVGGTSLKLNENGTRNSETVWNDSGRPSHEEEFKQYSATGGGCSTLFTAPSWQQDTPGWTHTACGTKRLDNDIAAVADPYTGFDIYDSYNCGKTCEKEGLGKGWITIGGTSLSSPLISSLYALAGGSGGVGYPAATLYGHLGQSSLYDVTEGGDGYCDGEAPGPCGEPEVNELLGNVDCEGTTACDAAPGFDGPSGVGAPKGLGAFKSNAITFLTQTSATLNAKVNPDGQAVTECEFEYGTSTTYGSSVPCKSLPGSGTSPVAVSANVTALTPNTEYHFRIVTKNAGGTIEGVDVTFHTLKVAAPSVETKAASGIGETSATLNASVNPRGGPLSACTFEYGTNTAYGSSVPCSALPGSGSSPVPVSASIAAGLAANTEYHYRISATNSSGTSLGADVTFKTG